MNISFFSRWRLGWYLEAFSEGEMKILFIILSSLLLALVSCHKNHGSKRSRRDANNEQTLSLKATTVTTKQVSQIFNLHLLFIRNIKRFVLLILKLYLSVIILAMKTIKLYCNDTVKKLGSNGWILFIWSYEYLFRYVIKLWRLQFFR